MNSIIPCPLCVAGSGKSKGHSGAHRLFTNKERKKRRQQVNRSNYAKRCRLKSKISVPIISPVNDPDESRTTIISRLQFNVRQENYWTDGTYRGKYIQLYFSEFHKHYNPYCKTSLPLDELSIVALEERQWVETWTEEERCYNHKKLLRAIPGMSTILGGKQWSYSEYSVKEAINIYIHFLDICLQKHPIDIKKKFGQCKKCGSDISFLEYQRFFWNYDVGNGCYHCVDKKDFPKNKHTRKEYNDDEIIEMIRDPTRWWKERKFLLRNMFGPRHHKYRHWCS